MNNQIQVKASAILFFSLAAVCRPQTPQSGFKSATAAGSASSTIEIRSQLIPLHGADYKLFNSHNVFSLTRASTYPDGTRGDWMHPGATANDPTVSNTHHINAADITYRRQVGTPQISLLSYTGVDGPAFSRFRSNVYFDWIPEDYDYTQHNFSSDYYYFIGNGAAFVRPGGSSFMVANCADASGVLIRNCSESSSITPLKTGPQVIYVFTRADGADCTLIVSQGTDSAHFDVASESAHTVIERVFSISINPRVTNTPYVVKWIARSIQPGATNGFIALNAIALGGVTAGNISDAELATTGYGPGNTPSHNYGTRVHQLDPVDRVPTPTSTITLALGASLQAAVKAAPCGRAIHLPLGWTQPAGEELVLPHTKCTGNAYIQIIADGARNTYGQRAQPSDYPGGTHSPAIIANIVGNGEAIRNDYNNPNPHLRGAHHFIFRGLEITAKHAGNGLSWAVVAFSSGTNPTRDSASHDNLFVGCYIHQDPSTPNQVNGLNFTSDASGIYDSTVGPFEAPNISNETHGMFMTGGLGPMTLKNNYVSGATETIIFGGGASSPYAILSDIEIVGNYFDKPVRYNVQPYPAGLDIKNTLEFKVGRYVTITGNVFNHGFAGYGQGGTAIFIRSLTFGGSFPNVTSNYLIENNVVRHSASGFAFEAMDSYGLGGNQPGGVYDAAIPLHFVARQYDIMVRNNSFEDISFKKYGSQGRGQGNSYFFYLAGLAANLTLDHNSGMFDSRTDNAKPSAKERDVAIIVPGLTGITIPERIPVYGSAYPGSAGPAASIEAASSFTLTNNLLGGNINGDSGPYQLPSRGIYSNNAFFNLVPYVDAYILQASFLAATHTQSATPTAVIPGQGVNSTTLPDCVVITGNRSDVSCVPGQ